MRKVKFRGKRVDNKEWIYGSLIVGYHGKQMYCNIVPITICEDCFVMPEVYLVIPETVGQYTGLKDISGKEIYEGDIVRYYIGSNDFPIDYNAVIEFAFGQWGFFVPYYKNVKKGTYKERFSHKIVNGIGYKFIPLVDLGSETIVLREFPKAKNIIKVQYEIVGNIYDNPELVR